MPVQGSLLFWNLIDTWSARTPAGSVTLTGVHVPLRSALIPCKKAPDDADWFQTSTNNAANALKGPVLEMNTSADKVNPPKSVPDGQTGTATDANEPEDTSTLNEATPPNFVLVLLETKAALVTPPFTGKLGSVSFTHPCVPDSKSQLRHVPHGLAAEQVLQFPLPSQVPDPPLQDVPRPLLLSTKHCCVPVEQES